MPVWLRLREIEYFLHLTINEDGGVHGKIDSNRLEATLARPQHLLAYRPESTVQELAAAYGFGFARDHCFADGNKRVALMSIDVFLDCKGYEFSPPEEEAVVIITEVAAGELEEPALASWIQENSNPKDSP